MHPRLARRPLTAGLALAVVCLQGSVGRAGEAPAALPAAVAQAWSAAGAEIGWAGRDAYARPIFRPAGSSPEAGDTPAFRISAWTLGLLARLPAPNRPFALELGKSGITDAGLKEVAGMVHLTRLGLGYTPVTDAGLKELAALAELRTLDLNHTAVDDAGLPALQALRQLEVLNLFATRTTDAGLFQLEPLQRLEILNIGSIKRMTDPGLAAVARLPRLRLIDLDAAKITDAGLASLKPLAHLRTLYLPSTKVVGTGLPSLAGLPLEDLVLAGDAVTDQTVAGVSALTGLRSLTLSRTRITDAGLAAVRPLRNLKVLAVARTQVTEAGLRQLQAELPGLQVKR